MKKTLLTACATIALSTAFAASDTQEATPLNDSRSQAQGETKKKARPAKNITTAKDGSTARGEGTGIP